MKKRRQGDIWVEYQDPEIEGEKQFPTYTVEQTVKRHLQDIQLFFEQYKELYKHIDRVYHSQTRMEKIMNAKFNLKEVNTTVPFNIYIDPQPQPKDFSGTPPALSDEEVIQRYIEYIIKELKFKQWLYNQYLTLSQNMRINNEKKYNLIPDFHNRVSLIAYKNVGFNALYYCVRVMCKILTRYWRHDDRINALKQTGVLFKRGTAWEEDEDGVMMGEEYALDGKAIYQNLLHEWERDNKLLKLLKAGNVENIQIVLLLVELDEIPGETEINNIKAVNRAMGGETVIEIDTNVKCKKCGKCGKIKY